MVSVRTNLSARPSVPENNGLFLRRFMRSILRVLGIMVERRAKPEGKSTPRTFVSEERSDVESHLP